MKNPNNNYERVSIELIPLCEDDVITTSNPFDGEDDGTEDWF